MRSRYGVFAQVVLIVYRCFKAVEQFLKAELTEISTRSSERQDKTIPASTI